MHIVQTFSAIRTFDCSRCLSWRCTLLQIQISVRRIPVSGHVIIGNYTTLLLYNAHGVVVLNVVVGSSDVVVASTVVVSASVVVGGAVVCSVAVATLDVVCSVVVVITTLAVIIVIVNFCSNDE